MERIIGTDTLALLIKAGICQIHTGDELSSEFRLIPHRGAVYIADKYNRENHYMVYLSYDSLVFIDILLEKTALTDISCHKSKK